MWGVGVGVYARGSLEKIARHEDPVSISTVNACGVRSGYDQVTRPSGVGIAVCRVGVRGCGNRLRALRVRCVGIRGWGGGDLARGADGDVDEVLRLRIVHRHWCGG